MYLLKIDTTKKKAWKYRRYLYISPRADFSEQTTFLVGREKEIKFETLADQIFWTRIPRKYSFKNLELVKITEE